jgi:aryl-alcohol dehydrogenase-like predicted oxidoreductase
MSYRNLGRHGVKVSPLSLGTMMFGGPTDEATSRRIIDKAWDDGVNFLDTADVYNDGGSEEVVGRAIASNRSRWFLATKFVNSRSKVPNEGGASRNWVIQATENSLKRLGTDYIDLQYLHREDHTTPVEETVAALGDLIRQGKIRYYGLSNHRAWKIAEFSRVADQLGVPRPSATQPCYNIANRQPEVEHLNAAEYYGLGVVSFSPLARGVLTGKYAPNEPPAPGTRAGRDDKRMHQTEWRQESLDLAQLIKKHAEARGITPGQFALAWVLNNKLITAAITGPRTEAHWNDYVGALSYKFTTEDEAFIDGLVVTGHPSTPGFNDPSHPFFGRQPRN